MEVLRVRDFLYFRAMELIMILRRCHHFRGFVLHPGMSKVVASGGLGNRLVCGSL
jgi:hypothetical protein